MPHYSWWHLPFYILDATFLIYTCFIFVQLGCLFTILVSYFSLCYCYQFNELNRILAALQHRVRQNQKLNHFLISSMRNVVRKHTILVHYIVYTNREVWGNALLIYVLFSIPVNAYMTSLALTETFSDFEVIIVIILTIGHIVNSAIPLVSVAYSIEANYRFRKHLIPVQASVGRDRLRLKLQLDDLFGRMSHGKKYGFTIGPMSPLSFSFLFEVPIYSLYT